MISIKAKFCLKNRQMPKNVAFAYFYKTQNWHSFGIVLGIKVGIRSENYLTKQKKPQNRRILGHRTHEKQEKSHF